MPPGIPVATVGLDGAQNAGILAAQILATADEHLLNKIVEFKAGLAKKIVQANQELSSVKYEFKTN
jgi:5-(carboxyamino)imidazole ribonucleotide mutase